MWLNRDQTRRTGKTIAPSSRPVQTIPGFDISLPALFPTPDTTAVAEDILRELQRMTANNGVDGAHAAALDALTADAMAPYFQNAAEHFATSLRIIQQLDQQAIDVATTAFERALKTADDAEQSEKEADAAYRAHVGIERTRSTYCEATDWVVLREKLRRHHLVLAADPETLSFVNRGFRADDRGPATVPGDESAPSHAEDRPPLKPLTTNNHPSYTTERH